MASLVPSYLRGVQFSAPAKSSLVREVSEKIDFSPFARETLPLALEHAQG